MVPVGRRSPLRSVDLRPWSLDPTDFKRTGVRGRSGGRTERTVPETSGTGSEGRRDFEGGGWDWTSDWVDHEGPVTKGRPEAVGPSRRTEAGCPSPTRHDGGASPGALPGRRVSWPSSEGWWSREACVPNGGGSGSRPSPVLPRPLSG